MIYFVFFLVELLILFFLSRRLTRLLLQSLGGRWYGLLFLPGVLLHELSHFFVALFLLVRTGRIEIFPRSTAEGQVQLGRVAIAKTDPIRRLLIGVAPIVIGAAVLLWAVSFFTTMTGITLFWRVIVLLLIFFEVTNTMFSSQKDMEGAIEFFIFAGIVLVGLWLAGLRVPTSLLEQIFAEPTVSFLRRVDIFLLVPLTIDLMLYGGMKAVRPR